MRRLTLISYAMLIATASVAAAGDIHMPNAAPPSRIESRERPGINQGEIGQRIMAAQDGETLTIGPGTYREHILINKSISLVGEGNPIIDGGGNGDIVEITAPGVTLHGFTLRNTGIDLDKENAAIRVLAPRCTVEDNTLEGILFGIDLREAPESIVRGNRIGGKLLDIARRGDGLRLWRSDNTLIENNIVHDGRDSILWYSKGIIVRGNVGIRCRYGLHLMFSDDVTIENNELSENSVGLYIMYSKVVRVRGNRLFRNRGPSGYGLGLKEADQFAVESNIFAGNRVGIYFDGSPFGTAKPSIVRGNTVACNDVGLTFLPSVRGNEISENNFVDNIEQVSVGGRGELKGNQFWRGERGNYWTDYVGYDENSDGVGDFVHESHTLFENMMDREPKLRILLFSPAQQAIEFIGRALPAVRPEPKFTDEVPLMFPVTMPTNLVRTNPTSEGLAWIGASLAAVGGGVLLLSRSDQPASLGKRGVR